MLCCFGTVGQKMWTREREKERDLELETENDGSICVLVCWVCCSACCPSITSISISIIVKRHGHTWNEAVAKGASCWHTSLYISTYVIYTHTNVCLSLCLLYMLKKTLCNNPSVVKQIFTNILQSEETSQKMRKKKNGSPLKRIYIYFAKENCFLNSLGLAWGCTAHTQSHVRYICVLQRFWTAISN